ncbi:MAG: 3-isopropylmalate dehydratase small subunit [Candidatus Neomarinimicrobiota bacterium]
MKNFKLFTGIVSFLDRDNIDTDAIIPKQFLKSIYRSGFGPYLFDEWRYLDHGEPGQDCSGRPLNPDFILNEERYLNTSVLLTGKNFGCGSSREHAPWALLDFGFKCIIAKSFADIFYNNCFKNGILPIVLIEKEIDTLLKDIKGDDKKYQLTIDLKNQCITKPDDKKIYFEIESFRKDALLEGKDDIEITLMDKVKIESFEQNHKKEQPWLFEK